MLVLLLLTQRAQSLDVASDVLNGVLRLLALVGVVSSPTPVWLNILFVILGFYSFPLGCYQVRARAKDPPSPPPSPHSLLRSLIQLTTRGKIKTNYRKIIHGDDPELAAALDAAGGVLTNESITIRHQLIVLDLAVATLSINGFLAEDVPSILLNGVVILLEMLEGTKADKTLLASFFSLLLSCAMAGRKAGLKQQRRELRQQKMDLEQMEQQGQDIRRFSESKRRLEQVNQELEEEVRLKKHSEEELKVMVSALEAVSKERQDELKEVMMESKELKIDRLLGKGGFGVVNLATYRGTKVAMKQVGPFLSTPSSPPLPCTFARRSCSR